MIQVYLEKDAKMEMKRHKRLQTRNNQVKST